MGKVLNESKKIENLHWIGLVNVALSQKKYVDSSCPRKTMHKEEGNTSDWFVLAPKDSKVEEAYSKWKTNSY